MEGIIQARAIGARGRSHWPSSGHRRKQGEGIRFPKPLWIPAFAIMTQWEC